MERIKGLDGYQKVVLVIMLAMSLVFAVIYPGTISRLGYNYNDVILVPTGKLREGISAGPFLQLLHWCSLLWGCSEKIQICGKVNRNTFLVLRLTFVIKQGAIKYQSSSTVITSSRALRASSTGLSPRAWPESCTFKTAQ